MICDKPSWLIIDSFHKLIDNNGVGLLSIMWYICCFAWNKMDLFLLHPSCFPSTGCLILPLWAFILINWCIRCMKSFIDVQITMFKEKNVHCLMYSNYKCHCYYCGCCCHRYQLYRHNPTTIILQHRQHFTWGVQIV